MNLWMFNIYKTQCTKTLMKHLEIPQKKHNEHFSKSFKTFI